MTSEMRRLAEEAKAQHAPRRAIPRRPEAPANQVSDKEMQRRLNALRLHQVQEKAAARTTRENNHPAQAKPDRDRDDNQI